MAPQSENLVDAMRAKEKFQDGVGKNASNEMRKIRATHFNNIGVGLAVAGYFVPTISILQRSLTLISEQIRSETFWTAGTPLDLKLSVIFTCGAVFLSMVYRIKAEKILITIED